MQVNAVYVPLNIICMFICSLCVPLCPPKRLNIKVIDPFVSFQFWTVYYFLILFLSLP